GIVEFATALSKRGVTLLSTGGTARTLAENGLEVTDVSQVTNFPEIMDGRVKTLHPSIHGALLAIRDDEDHAAAMDAHGIDPIDLVVVNLYPFEEVAASGASYAQSVENIDIGGPAMIRASAKNHAYVATLTSPDDYSGFVDALKQNEGSTPFEYRKKLAAQAFARTAAYDSAISSWYQQALDISTPERIAVSGRLEESLRYGENPHQTAALYLGGEPRYGVATAKQLQGKQLSYNNINDTDAAFELISEFPAKDGPAVAIIKHANPCGVAVGNTLEQAYKTALSCDPVSAFGGILALNGELDAQTAGQIIQLFTEVIIAPTVSDDAREIIATKKNLRLLVTGALADPADPGISLKSIAGGYLVQSRDNGILSPENLTVVTMRQPEDQELADMLFAFKVAKHVKSNAIVYARDGATVGIGAGQMSRIDSSRIAARKAEDAAQTANLPEPLTRGSVVASDAFFPFADGLISAIEAGATAVIQPGGSMRDDEVIRAADDAGIAMVFTGMRHFRH
ncbi:MAG: bifunctional phosphoribosylaminoimidazolecarboxamide formyltransferase/IMP cyclohydrolase, partial [Pseudomonadota bacterium]